MSHLLDVNLLAACAWQSHARHREANRRLQNLTRFATCPVGQMGFLRVSMSPAYGPASPTPGRRWRIFWPSPLISFSPTTPRPRRCPRSPATLGRRRGRPSARAADVGLA